MSRVLGDVLCDLDPKVKVKGEIMYFLENACDSVLFSYKMLIGILVISLDENCTISEN